MAPGEIQEIKEKIDEVTTGFGDLKATIEQRIQQEERLQHEKHKTLKAELGGEIKVIETAFKAHAAEQRVYEEKSGKSLTRIHERTDDLHKTMVDMSSGLNKSMAQIASSLNSKNLQVGNITSNQSTLTFGKVAIYILGGTLGLGSLGGAIWAAINYLPALLGAF